MDNSTGKFKFSPTTRQSEFSSSLPPMLHHPIPIIDLFKEDRIKKNQILLLLSLIKRNLTKLDPELSNSIKEIFSRHESLTHQLIADIKQLMDIRLKSHSNQPEYRVVSRQLQLLKMRIPTSTSELKLNSQSGSTNTRHNSLRQHSKLHILPILKQKTELLRTIKLHLNKLELDSDETISLNQICKSLIEKFSPSPNPIILNDLENLIMLLQRKFQGDSNYLEVLRRFEKLKGLETPSIDPLKPTSSLSTSSLSTSLQSTSPQTLQSTSSQTLQPTSSRPPPWWSLSTSSLSTSPSLQTLQPTSPRALQSISLQPTSPQTVHSKVQSLFPYPESLRKNKFKLTEVVKVSPEELITYDLPNFSDDELVEIYNLTSNIMSSDSIYTSLEAYLNWSQYPHTVNLQDLEDEKKKIYK